MSVCVHHKSIAKQPRARKYQVTQAQRQPRAPVPFDKKYKPKALPVVYDLETTGLIEENVEMVNLAAEVDDLIVDHLRALDEDEEMKDDEEYAWFESLIKPSIHNKIPAEVVAIHGISDKDVAKAPRSKEVLEEFVRWLSGLRSTYNLPSDFPILLVAHNNYRFDQVILQWEMLRCGVVLPADVYFADTLYSIRNAFGFPWSHSAYISGSEAAVNQKSEMSLSALVKRICLREGFQQQHAAMSDVEALLDVMHAFQARQDLYEALWQDRQAAYTHKKLTEIVEEEGNKTRKRRQYAQKQQKRSTAPGEQSNNKRKKL